MCPLRFPQWCCIKSQLSGLLLVNIHLKLNFSNCSWSENASKIGSWSFNTGKILQKISAKNASNEFSFSMFFCVSVKMKAWFFNVKKVQLLSDFCRVIICFCFGGKKNCTRIRFARCRLRSGLAPIESSNGNWEQIKNVLSYFKLCLKHKKTLIRNSLLILKLC